MISSQNEPLPDPAARDSQASILNRLENFKARPITAYALVTTATFMMAGSIVLGRAVHEDIPPVGLSFWRWSVAALVLLPLVWRELRYKWPIIAAHRNLLVLLGILQVGSSTLVYVAVNFTTAINASLIFAAQPALTIIPAWFLTQDRATMPQCLGICAALFGIVVMVTQADVQNLLSLELNVGDILTLAAIFGWSFYAALLHRLPNNLGHTTSLFLICVTGSLSIIPFYAYETVALRTFPFTTTTIVVILFLAVLVSAVSGLFWNMAVRSVGPNRATIFMNLIPIFGVVLAIMVLGERLFAYHVIGASFVVLGVVLVVFRTKGTAEP